MFGMIVFMHLSRTPVGDRIDAETKWRDGNLLIKHDFGFDIMAADEYLELDARIGVQNYMHQTFFGGSLAEFNNFQSLLHNKDCRIVVVANNPSNTDREDDADVNSDDDKELRIWFSNESDMVDYKTEAIRIFIKLDKFKYNTLRQELATQWSSCVVQARVYEKNNNAGFDNYIKGDKIAYARELSIGIAVQFVFSYDYSYSEYRYN